MHNTIKINFMNKRLMAFGISGLFILLSIASLAYKGLSFGIDFTGGTVIEVGYKQPVDLQKIRQSLANAGFKDITAQYFGSSQDVLIRIAPQEGEKGESGAKIGSKILSVLQQDDASVQMRRVEFVGPQVGDELKNDGGLAVLFSLIGIFIYVWTRFEWQFATGSIIALVHDVIITLGVFSFFQIEFNLTVLAAILAVIGYSLNDTIVVFDRIRENFRVYRKKTPEQIMDLAINQMLSRTIVTSLTTLIVLLTLLFLGGEIIFGFALALSVGVVVGTYSSIYIASASVLAFGISREALLPPAKEKEGEDVDLNLYR
ncbi:MAG: protein translocase subunit SecF [Gammaproteobacteria bacterium]|nr:MAG: protein translocase subunit SecF [Gammaproteobacteria bacterium]